MLSDYIRYQIRLCEQEIASCDAIIRSLEKEENECEVLRQRVRALWESFEEKELLRKTRLQSFMSMPNSRTAQRYYQGMSGFLNGVENQRAHEGFERAYVKVKRKLHEISSNIEEKTTRREYLRRKLNELYDQLRASLAAEEASRAAEAATRNIS